MYELLVAVGSSPYFEFANTPLESLHWRLTGRFPCQLSSSYHEIVSLSWRVRLVCRCILGVGPECLEPVGSDPSIQAGSAIGDRRIGAARIPIA